MVSTKDLSGLPNAERLKNFCKGLAALDIIMVEEEWSFIRHYTYNPAWRKGKEAFFATDGSDQSMSTYESRRGLMRNYITPIIGDMCLGEITPRMMDKYYRDLLSVKAVSVNNRKPTNEYLTPHTVREIHKLLRNAFNQAVRWELIARNPVLNATLPKEEHKERKSGPLICSQKRWRFVMTRFYCWP